MSESYERSYYEVALTNNQVLSALAVLLLCLLAAFVAGMWVAKEAVVGEPTRVASVEEAAAEMPKSEAGEFRFFKRQGAGEDAPAGTKSVAAEAPEKPASTARGAAPETQPKREPSRVVRNIRPVEVAPNEPPSR